MHTQAHTAAHHAPTRRWLPALLPLAAALLFAGLAPTAEAGALSVGAERVYHQSRGDRRGRSESAQVKVSLDQAVDIVRRRTKGKVIGSSTRRSGGRVSYRVKVLANGNVRTYTVDAATGSVSN